MHEVSHRLRGRKLEYAKRHYDIVCKHVSGGICFVVPINLLENLVASHGLKETYVAKPYSWAFKGVINGLAQNQRNGD